MDAPVETRDATLSADLDAARGGDEEAFVRVWRELHPALLRYLRVRGDESPEDVASETWMQALRAVSYTHLTLPTNREV